MSDISLGSAPPETVLEPFAQEALIALEEAVQRADAEDLKAVAGRWPRMLAAWASLAEFYEQVDPVAAYAFARTGYHRGLDALRAAGWRGSGYVRWQHAANRGFLRCLYALGRAAGQIGEADEEARCVMFLHQLDPDWRRHHGDPAGQGEGRA